MLHSKWKKTKPMVATLTMLSDEKIWQARVGCRMYINVVEKSNLGLKKLDAIFNGGFYDF